MKLNGASLRLAFDKRERLVEAVDLPPRERLQCAFRWAAEQHLSSLEWQNLISSNGLEVKDFDFQRSGVSGGAPRPHDSEIDGVLSTHETDKDALCGQTH